MLLLQSTVINSLTRPRVRTLLSRSSNLNYLNFGEINQRTAANKFVKRIDNMLEANNWSNNIAFSNFAMALRGSAKTWLDSQVRLKGIKGDRRKWSIINPFFKAEFAVESDDKLILDRLAFLRKCQGLLWSTRQDDAYHRRCLHYIYQQS
jgi:hypothetical protein